MEEFSKFTEEEESMQNMSESDMYLEEKLLPCKFDGNEEKFKILDWWKANSLKFCILSRMSYDILATPVSTLPQRVFSIDGRVLDQYHSSLLLITVEALICTQDWLRVVTKNHKEEMILLIFHVHKFYLFNNLL